MANTPSAEKRIRQARRRAENNRSHRSQMKTAIKKVMGAPDADAATAAYREVSALLDRMATRRIIHPNKAARKKSQLARHVSGIAG